MCMELRRLQRTQLLWEHRDYLERCAIDCAVHAGSASSLAHMLSVLYGHADDMPPPLVRLQDVSLVRQSSR